MRLGRLGTRRTARGMTMVELVISLAIMAVIFAGIWHGVRIYTDYQKGKRIASAMKPYYQALIDYTRTYRTNLTTSVAVTGVANAYAPTIAELQTLNLLHTAYNGTVPEVSGSPAMALTLIPTGCVGAACDIGMRVTYPAAVMSGNFPAYRALTYAVQEFGADAGFSTNDTPGTISAVGWSQANPLGSVAGVFGTYITYSASGYAQYLVVGDLRDPMFVNNVTVGGTITAVQSVGSGTATGVTGTCQLAQLMNSAGAGQLVARASDCVARVFANGSDGSVETRSATGAARVRLGGDGTLTSYSSTGSTSAGISYTGTVSTVFGDELRNTSNTGGVTSSGSVWGTTATFSGPSTLGGGATITGTVTLVTTQTAGAACTAAGQFARQTDGQLLACISNVWRVQGLARSTEGSACTDGLALDSTDTTKTLVCRNSVYVSLNSALGRIAWLDNLSVVNGTVVSAPSCGTGSTAVIQVVPSQFQTPMAGGTVRYSYSGSGPWTISITGSSGAEGIAWRGCQYSVL